MNRPPSDPSCSVDLAAAVQDCLLELVHSGSTRAPLARLCDSCRNLLLAESCEIYVAGAGLSDPVLVAASEQRDNPLTLAQWKSLAAIAVDATAAESGDSLLFPLRHEGNLVGAMRAHWSENAIRNHESLEQFADMVPLLARIMVSVQLAHQQRRHDLYEERAAISRELHDSLAQSLTYLKIQASRLDQSLGSAIHDDALPLPGEILNEFRSTLSDAYRQLRELMTTFRLTMHGKSFRHAVREAVDEFTDRSNIGFELDNAWRDDSLTVEEEMQVLQIIREALYNVVRHSRADLARVSLSIRDNTYRVQIEDNGVGMNAAQRKNRHHGLVIMQERTSRLDGSLRITPPQRGGTIIELEFVPRAMRP